MDFGAGNSQVINGYTIFAGNAQSDNPRVWQFQGSDDNTIWTNLHSFSAATAIATSGSYSIASIGNTQPYRYYRLNVTANGGGTILRVVELELYATFTTAIVVGGTFNFDTPNITANVTSLTAPLNQGANNLIQVLSNTGTVNINFSSTVTAPNLSLNLISHSGSCNFVLSGTTFTVIPVTNNNCVCISKTSSGTITVFGDLIGSASSSAAGGNALRSANGNTIIIGNVFGPTAGSQNNTSVSQTIGNLTISGNAIGGGNTGSPAVTFAGSLLTVNGGITGGSGNVGVSTSAPLNIVNGNIVGGTASGLVSSSGNRIELNGNAIASATAPAISSSNLNSQVFLNGNMFNTSSEMAIYAPRIWLNRTGTTQSRFFTFGGVDRTLYSEDTFPNLPPTSSVTFNTLYGPENSLIGTMVIPSSSDTASGVNVGNTFGAALLSTQTLLDEIKNSSDPMAIRLRNSITPEILGYILEAFNK
jgi:hypothetical protein